MQRWIVVAVIAMAMVFGGGFFAFRTYKENRPYPVWVPLPINPELSTDRQDALAKDLKEKLADPKVLARVSKDLGLTTEWKMGSDAQCADEIKNRLIVRVGTTNNRLGSVPSLDVGIKGKAKERAMSEKISLRLIKDVCEILGIDPLPTK